MKIADAPKQKRSRATQSKRPVRSSRQQVPHRPGIAPAAWSALCRWHFILGRPPAAERKLEMFRTQKLRPKFGSISGWTSRPDRAIMFDWALGGWPPALTVATHRCRQHGRLRDRRLRGTVDFDRSSTPTHQRAGSEVRLKYSTTRF